MNPGLYIISTPIGRLKDITFSAIEVLQNADLVLCEDTRVTIKLLEHYSIKAKLVSLHKYNEVNSIKFILDKIKEGLVLALVSDAGTPAIHDPGYRLVKAVQEENLYCTPIPGPSSVTTALSVAGCSADNFLFLGFLPSKSGDLLNALNKINANNSTVVCFESPHRIEKSLRLISQKVPGDREIVLCKELTKKHEKILCMNVSEIQQALEQKNINFKGEWVLVLRPFTSMREVPSCEAKKILKLLLPVVSLNQAVQITKNITKEPKNDLYQFALNIKDSSK